jgi:HK97 family phage prohead protease
VNKIFHIGSTFKAFEEGDDLHIAGMASTNGTDRVGDVIETEAWTKGGLQNYLNNPVILFNHDYNQPIGRAVSLGTNDNGLQLKAKIAKSAGHVGELIKEGVLGAFSVGFRVKDAEYMTETDGYKIKDAELLEVSVVTVPANQAATFSLAKSFNSDSEYEEFKKSFKINDSEEKHVLNIQETEDKVTVEFEKHSNESMPKDSSRVEAQEKTMSDIDIDAIVAAAVEKTAAAMAMKDAERKAEEQAKMEAEQKAAAEAEAQKAAEEQRIVTAVSSGAEKLMADVEARMAEKDADVSKIIGELQNELKEKADEIEKMRESKRVFSDRAEKSSPVSEEDMVNAHILGVVTNKGMNTRFGKSVMEKVNTNAGVTVPTSTNEDFETTVSTAIERDIQLELVLDPLFRKIQMNAASMVIPTMPDAGYAEWLTANAAGTGSSGIWEGNVDARGVTPQTGSGIGLGNTVLTVEKLVSKSFMANETEEDSIMPILPLIREAMVRSHARAIEHSLLVGGSTDQTNTGGKPGLVKTAFDDSKVLTSAASPGPYTATTEALLNMRQSMGKYGRRPSDVVYIVSLDAYYDLLDDAEFQDVNLVGSDRATKISGEIGQAYGSPIIVCDEFKGGKVDGQYWGIAVNVRNFVVPVLRGVTVESDYDVENQRRVLVATQRRGFHQMFSDAGQVIAHTW